MVFLSPPVSEEPRPPRAKARTKRQPETELAEGDEIEEVPSAKSPTKKGKGKASQREPSPEIEDDPIHDPEPEATPPPKSKPTSKPLPAQKASPSEPINTPTGKEKDKKGKRKAVDEPADDDRKAKSKKKKAEEEPVPAPKKRGRPAKPAAVAPVESDEEAAVSLPKKKKMRKLNAVTSFDWESIKFGVSLFMLCSLFDPS